MKVSVITATYNSEDYVQENIDSVFSQTYNNVEHIVVDGKSTDKTLNILKENEHKIAKWTSEPDNGIYDAMNKGINFATGEVIAFLNSDDFYADGKVIEKVVNVFKNNNVDSVYGDLVYVSKKSERRVRSWNSGEYSNGIMEKGWMPPHPTFFVKKEIFDKFGFFYTNFKISADYELMLRFLHKHRISTYYIPEVLVKMRTGGESNRVRNYISKYKEDYEAMKINNIKLPFYCLLNKSLSKIPQFFLHLFQKSR